VWARSHSSWLSELRRSGYCFYCLNSKGKINEDPCEYGTAYILAWFQLVWLCVVIANPYFRALAMSPTETTQALVIGSASSGKYSQFDDSNPVPSAPLMSTQTRQVATNSYEEVVVVLSSSLLQASRQG